LMYMPLLTFTPVECEPSRAKPSEAEEDEKPSH
jgi:hypothetical protein